MRPRQITVCHQFLPDPKPTSSPLVSLLTAPTTPPSSSLPSACLLLYSPNSVSRQPKAYLMFLKTFPFQNLIKDTQACFDLQMHISVLIFLCPGCYSKVLEHLFCNHSGIYLRTHLVKIIHISLYIPSSKKKIENHRKTDVVKIYRNRTMEPKAKHLHK